MSISQEHERMLLFTINNCHQCNVAKEKLKKRGIAYTEVNVMESKHNENWARKYDVKMAGTVIDTETGFPIDLSDEPWNTTSK